jgi:hypothetical protein
MAAFGSPTAAGLSLAVDRAEGIQVGKRYLDDETGLEVLCSKAGAGSLSLNGKPLAQKEAKKLPSSD